MIKQFNLDRLWCQVRQEALLNIDKAFSRGIAQESQDVESELCKLTGRKFAITTSNCTDAMTIILRSMNYPKGSKILVPCYSFIATATPIIIAGLTPVFVDVNENYHLDLEKVVVTSDIKAMLLVSLFGNPADYEKYEKFCDHYGIDLIEDSAQSLGSSNGKSSGSVGIASAMSFSPTKPCPVLGSGGAIMTDNENLATLCRLGRLHGKTKNIDLTYNLGINSMMSSGEAAQLIVGLKYRAQWQNRRTAISKYYDSQLKSFCFLPPRQGEHNWHKYVIRIDNADELINKANNNGVQLAKHYARLITDEPIFSCETIFKVSERYRNQSVSLPICPHMTDAEVETVVDFIVNNSKVMT